MTTKIYEPADAGRQMVVLERTFNAPRELLFRLFTDPAHLARWWVPYPLTCTALEFDARPGGSHRFVMRATEEIQFPFIGKILEVDPPNLLVFTTADDVDDAGVPHTEVRQTINFKELEGKTVVRLLIEVLQSCETTAENLKGMTGGWMQDFGRLEFYLLLWTADDNEPVPSVATPSDREVVVSRTFDSPRERVFQALTDPAIIPKWWGSGDLQATVESMDVRPRGKWRFLQQRPGGDVAEYGGEYVLIEPSELVVTSLESGPTAGKDVMNAVHLFEHDGKTRLTSISLFWSKAERDEAVNAGIASEAIESYERLAQLLS